MILVTLGTHGQPMPRLVAPLAVLSTRHELAPFVMQHGRTPLPAGWSGAPDLAPSDLAALIKGAVVVITHGGPATIAEVRAAGKIPVVVPRRRAFGEHVDDHQVWYARRLAEAGEVILVDQVAELPRIVAAYDQIVAPLPAPTTHDPAPAIAAFATVVARLESRS